jgi:hypothetical protein
MSEVLVQTVSLIRVNILLKKDVVVCNASRSYYVRRFPLLCAITRLQYCAYRVVEYRVERTRDA